MGVTPTTWEFVSLSSENFVCFKVNIFLFFPAPFVIYVGLLCLTSHQPLCHVTDYDLLYTMILLSRLLLLLLLMVLPVLLILSLMLILLLILLLLLLLDFLCYYYRFSFYSEWNEWLLQQISFWIHLRALSFLFYFLKLFYMLLSKQKMEKGKN